ncbi:MAG TPA: hypothetical protein VMK12_31785, partial [Anaeromyxobacteraceae bacterium]|nr:hypothetical protein [Anaeromyxobacteraceae bacterium]
RVCLFDGRRARAVGVGNPTPLAGSCCSLDAAHRSSGFAAGNGRSGISGHRACRQFSKSHDR